MSSQKTGQQTIGFDVAARCGGWVSVTEKRFAGGARGDGTTDDTAAIQAAIDAAPGKRVVLPYTGSDYVISSALTCSHGIAIEGQGRQVKIRQTTANPVLRLVPTDSSANDRIFQLENLYLVNGTIGLDIAPTAYLHRLSRFRNINTYGQTDTGIYIHGGEACCLGTTWENVAVDGPAVPYGIRSVGFAQLNASTWTNALVKGSTTEAFRIEETETGYQTTAVNLINLDVEANGGKGLVVVGAQVNLHGGHMEQNGLDAGGADLDISGGSGGAVVNWFGGYLVSPGAAQSNRRILFTSAGGGIKLRLYGTRVAGTDIIDGNSQTSGSRISYYGVSPLPVLSNFSQGAASFSPDAAVVPNLNGTFAQTFSAWEKLRSSIGTATTAPDGTANAYPLIEDSTAANSHLVRRALVVPNGATQTFHVVAKANGRSWIQVLVNDSADHSAYFNLSTGAVGATGLVTAATSQSLGDGWYWCAIQYTAGAASSTAYVFLASADSGRIYDGDGASGVLLWRAKLETAGFL